MANLSSDSLGGRSFVYVYHKTAVECDIVKAINEIEKAVQEVDSQAEKTKKDIGGARFYNGPTPAERHFCALKRILDREEIDYAS